MEGDEKEVFFSSFPFPPSMRGLGLSWQIFVPSLETIKSAFFSSSPNSTRPTLIVPVVYWGLPWVCFGRWWFLFPPLGDGDDPDGCFSFLFTGEGHEGPPPPSSLAKGPPSDRPTDTDTVIFFFPGVEFKSPFPLFLPCSQPNVFFFLSPVLGDRPPPPPFVKG